MFSLHTKVAFTEINIDIRSRITFLPGGASGSGKGAFCDLLQKACDYMRIPCVIINYRNYWNAPSLTKEISENTLLILDNAELYTDICLDVLEAARCNIIVIGRTVHYVVMRLPMLSFTPTPNKITLEEK